MKRIRGWKVYDVTFAGISLVGSYRTTFSADVQRGGIDELIRALAEKNRALAAKKASGQS